jgi:uncharacterized protein YndB with AHSA1/START domain
MGLLLLAVLAALLWAARTPFRYATVIHAPAERIYPLLDDPRSWAAWSMQAVLDPTVRRTYEGPARGKGAVAKWESDGRAGAGTMEITEVVPNARVTVTFDLTRPGHARSVSVFKLVPSGASTKLVWTSTGGHMGLARAVRVLFGLFQSSTGKDGGSFRVENPFDAVFVKGLARIKAIAESAELGAPLGPGAEPYRSALGPDLLALAEGHPPASADVVVPGVGLTVVRRWRSPGITGRVISALATDAGIVFVVLIFTHPIALGRALVMPRGPILWLIALSAGAAALKGTYAALADLLNATTVAVEGNELRVKHGPLPLRRGVVIALGDIHDVLCEAPDPGSHAGRDGYGLSVVRQNAKKIALVNGLPSDEAWRFQRALEEHLRLEDRGDRAALIPLPPELDRIEGSSPGAIAIRYRWSRESGRNFATMALGWIGFAVLLIVVLPVSFSTVAIWLVVLLIGLCFAYAAAAGLLNSAFITVSDGRLNVRERPVSFGDGRSVPTDSVKQLTCETVETRNTRYRNLSSFSYSLWADLKDGPRFLIVNVPRRDLAGCIERLLTGPLGIESEPGGGKPQ